MANYFELLDQWGLEGSDDFEEVMEMAWVVSDPDQPIEARRRQGMALASWAVTQAWEALPPELRQQAREVAFDVMTKLLTAVGEAFAPLQEVIGEVGDTVPVFGWVVELIEFVFFLVVDEVKQVVEDRAAQSEVDRAIYRFYTIQKAVTSPGQAVRSGVWLENYLRYYRPGSRINNKAWRYEPVFRPTGSHGTDDAANLWGTSAFPPPEGYNAGNPVPGVPGRPFRKIGGGASGLTPTQTYKLFGSEGEFRPYPDTGENPRAVIVVSALLYPWSIPQAAPSPLPTLEGAEGYGPAVNGVIDPNALLIAAQANLLSLWHYNLRAPGAKVRQMNRAFSERFYEALVSNEWKARQISYIGTERFLGTATAEIDPVYSLDTDEALTGTNEVRFYAKNNRLFAYGNTGADPADYGFAGPENYGDPPTTTIVSLAQWNLVQVMVGAFFSARRRFLTTHYAKMIVEESFELWPGKMLTLDDLDEEIRDTVVALSKPPKVYEIDPDSLPGPTPLDPGLKGIAMPKFEPPDAGAEGGWAPPPKLPDLGPEGTTPDRKKKSKKTEPPSLLLPLGLAAAAAAGGVGLWWYNKQPKKKGKSKPMAMKKQTRNILIGAGVVAGVATLGYVGYQAIKPKKKKTKPKPKPVRRAALDTASVPVDEEEVARVLMDEAWNEIGRPEGTPQVWHLLAADALSILDPGVDWPDSPETFSIWATQAMDTTQAQKDKYQEAYELAQEVTKLSVIPQNGMGQATFVPS